MHHLPSVIVSRAKRSVSCSFLPLRERRHSHRTSPSDNHLPAEETRSATPNASPQSVSQHFVTLLSRGSPTLHEAAALFCSIRALEDELARLRGELQCGRCKCEEVMRS